MNPPLLPSLAVSLLALPSLGRAAVVWDTTGGANDQPVRASYENAIAGDWISLAAPVELGSAKSVVSLSLVGAHLRPSNGAWEATDFAHSSYRVNAWSSLDAFAASPRLGDLFSSDAALDGAAPYGRAGNVDAETHLVRFSLSAPMALPRGATVVGVYGLGLPLTLGALYWTSTTTYAPLGGRVRHTGGYEALPSPLALRLETQAVPEPGSMAALGLGVAVLVRRRLALSR